MSRLETFLWLQAAVLGIGLAVGLPANAGQVIPIRIGTGVDPIATPFWIAEEEGLYRKHGLQATETMFGIPFQGLLAIGSGQGDTSIQTDPPTISNIAKGIDAVIVAVLARGMEQVKLVAKRSIRTPRDLAGKRFGIALGSGGEYIAAKYLQAHGMSLRDVTVVDLQPSEAVPLLDKGELDAIMYWEPWPRKALHLSGDKVHVVATNRGVHETRVFLTVRRQFVQQNPEGIPQLLRALGEAMEVIRRQPDKAVAAYQRRLRTDVESARADVGDWEFGRSLDDKAVQALQEVATWIKEKGRIKEVPDWRQVIDPRPLRVADPGAVRNIAW